jgi:hypothetical protein
MRQCGDSSVQCFLHHSDQRRWKRSVGKILHWVPSESKFPVNRGLHPVPPVIAESKPGSTDGSMPSEHFKIVPHAPVFFSDRRPWSDGRLARLPPNDLVVAGTSTEVGHCILGTRSRKVLKDECWY